MNLIAIKSDLHELIDKIEDEKFLSALKTIVARNFRDQYPIDETDPIFAEELSESIHEADNNDIIDHTEAMKQIKSRYNL
jgi:hypothetical protein